MNRRTLNRAAVMVLATGALVVAQVAAATAGPSTMHITARLKVTAGPPPACHAGLCTIKNSGIGHLTHFGKVTFTTVVTADDRQPPCGATSQWVNRIVRTIHATKGNLVLHEAGLQCPDAGVGPRVDAVWAVDGADSTGTFAGATGHGTDVAYPIGETAAPTGTLTVTK